MEYLSQADILYTNGWQYEHDSCFISAIFKGRGSQQLSLDTKNDSVIRFGLWELNKNFGCTFTFAMCKRRFRFLFERYTSFKQITEHPGENPLVRAYVWNGEPTIVQFNAIFGPTIINVSSDSSRSYGEGLQPMGPKETLIVEDSEEANQISITLDNPLPRKGESRLD
ncbi:hypothetical protein BUALT_Bualt15G0083100 [Buddleja alternifolia]|uniref:Phenolic acid decarboxylase n=1 Tax=Buddleja alternifolia TaxID=168488 RepID=A0AAV6WK60_9LAMI|nr:hypothetical protein BUALT_Bualt15G0083100 [Buddleja alternifolia]